MWFGGFRVLWGEGRRIPYSLLEFKYRTRPKLDQPSSLHPIW